MKLTHSIMFMAALGTTIPTIAAQTPKPTPVSFNAIAQQCGNGVHPNTLQAIARVESSFNPYAIGVVKGKLTRQPRNLAEALATVRLLHAQGKNFSMGLMQVNRYNLKSFGLNYETVFDVCKNISAGSKILTDCYNRAGGKTQQHLHKAFSCYYSGNFKTGFRSDFKGQPPYVHKIIKASLVSTPKANIQYTGLQKTVGQRSSPPIAVPMVQPMQASLPITTVQAALPQPDIHFRQPEKPIAVKRKSHKWDIFQELQEFE